jgi:hypothetical protein
MQYDVGTMIQQKNFWKDVNDQNVQMYIEYGILL